ncbi:cytochrome bd oxidase small subunit CydS [Neobacillus bataviensis]
MFYAPFLVLIASIVVSFWAALKDSVLEK